MEKHQQRHSMAPPDSLDMGCFSEILKHLDVFSRHRAAWSMRAWKRHWEEIKAGNPEVLRRTPDSMPPALFGANSLGDDNVRFTFHDMYSEAVHQVMIAGLRGVKTFIGAGEGWVIPTASRDRTFLLTNPLTREERPLPATYMSGNMPISCNFKKIVFGRSPDHADGLFLIGLPHLMGGRVAYLTAEEMVWKRVQGPEGNRSAAELCHDAVIHGHHVYVVTSDHVYRCPILEGSAVGQPSQLPPINGPDLRRFATEKYVAIRGQSLTVITRVNGFAARGDNRPTRVYIYTCNLHGAPIVWDRVQSLEDTALFLGSGNSFSVNVRCCTSVKANHVYFSDHVTHRDGRGRVISKVADYDLSSRLFQPLTYRRHVESPIWIKPSFKRIDQ